MTNLFQIEEPNAAGKGKPSFALWELGFRPFYLLASSFSALSIALWALQMSGWLGQPYLQGPLWHAHEMLFGFVLAVIVGFLLTAGRNWANLPTPTGARLAALAALWVGGRILVLTPFGWAAALVNAAFPLAAATALAIPFIKAGSRRNYFFVGLLCLMSVAVMAVHLEHLGVLHLPGWVGIQVALDVVLIIVAVMGGRVIPMFTNNGVPGANAGRHAVLEQASIGVLALILVADAFQQRGAVLILLAVAAAAIHLARWSLWRPWKTLRVPIVWVLHVAYLWIPVHFVLRAMADPGWIGASLAAHALTVGAIGGVTIGMMTRTALGHTGRPLRAGRWEVACYVLIALAGVVRVLVPLAFPDLIMSAVLGSAALWSAGFGLYAIRYWPLLTRPRVDGKPG